MKKIMLIITVILLSYSVTGQDQAVKSRAERKAEREKAREIKEKEMIVTTERAIMSGNFVLKADRLRNKYGSTIMVNPSINFIAVKGKEVYVQFGNESGIGYNGVGGLTLRGTLTDYQLTRDKESNGYTLLFTTTGTNGSLTISMHSNIRGDMADARVQSNWGGSLTFSGEVVPVVGSRIFKGTESN